MKVVIPVYWLSGIAEVITYAPMLGAGGTYLSFVTGNITNLKLPCGLNAMENAGVRANSEEGEVISTIALGYHDYYNPRRRRARLPSGAPDADD